MNILFETVDSNVKLLTFLFISYLIWSINFADIYKNCNPNLLDIRFENYNFENPKFNKAITKSSVHYFELSDTCCALAYNFDGSLENNFAK